MQLSANGLSIEVQDHGSPADEPVLLIMGLGMQLVAWPDPFVRQLLDRGFRVVRFDNRDVGLSQGFDAQGAPRLMWQAMRHTFRLPVASAYTLDDMAADALGVLDALRIERAHVVGVSMGGMIAQLVALSAPRRVRSLTLMMTTPGGYGLPGPSTKVRSALMNRPPSFRYAPDPPGQRIRPDPRDIDALVEHGVALWRLIGSPGYRESDDALRARLRRAVSRSWRPEGVARQITAIMAAPGRTRALSALAMPTQVIHGLEDPLVPVQHGRALAAAITGAQLHQMPGMGHDLPDGLLETFVNLIAALAGKGPQPG